MSGKLKSTYDAPNGKTYHAEIGVIEYAHLGITHYGGLSGDLGFTFPGGTVQGTGGHALDDKPLKDGPRLPHKAAGAWVVAVLTALGVDDYSKVKGCTAFALRESDAWGASIVGVVGTAGQEPMIFSEVFECASA